MTMAVPGPEMIGIKNKYFPLILIHQRIYFYYKKHEMLITVDNKNVVRPNNLLLFE